MTYQQVNQSSELSQTIQSIKIIALQLKNYFNATFQQFYYFLSMKHSLIVSQYSFTAFVSHGYKIMKFPCQYTLTWKSGTQKASGSKIIHSQQSGMMQFDDELKLTVKVSQNPETGEFEKKKSMIYLNLKTENHPEFREISHIVIDLGEWIDNPRLGEEVEYSFEKDKESKLFIRMEVEKVRDVNPSGYIVEQQRFPHFGAVDSLKNSRQIEKPVDDINSQDKNSIKSKESQLSALQKLSEQLQSAYNRNKEQERTIFNYKMVQEQFALQKIDLEAKVQEHRNKNINDELRIAELELKLQQLIDVQSQLQNVKWENNQLKSQIETARRINQIKHNLSSENNSQIQSQNERILRDRLMNIESDCTSLLYQLKQREEVRKEIEEKFMMTEEECKNLNYLLEQKDLEVITLKEKIDSLSQSYNQFHTPVKTEQMTVQTSEMGIQYSETLKNEERKEYMTPQGKKTEEDQKYVREVKSLKVEIELKNEEINRLLNNIMNIEQHKIENMEKEKKRDESYKQLEKDNSLLNKQIQKLKNDLEIQQTLVRQLQIHKTVEATNSRTQQIMKQKIHSLEEQINSLQEYIKTLEQENRELSEQHQHYLISENQKPVKHVEQKSIQIEQSPSHQNKMAESNASEKSPERSRITQLKALVDNLEEENKFIIAKAKQDEEENNRLRAKLHEAEQVIESLKKQINLDAQDIELIKLQLEKQKAITRNVDDHLSAEKRIVNEITEKLHKTEEEYFTVTRQLEELQLKRSRKREKREHSKTKYENEIKALSDEVIRLHEELFKSRMIIEMAEKKEGDLSHVEQQIPVSRNIFPQKSQSEQINRLIKEIQTVKQQIKSFPNSETINTLLQLLSCKAKDKRKQALHLNKIKSWIDQKLREANSHIQKIKSGRSISLEQRRRITQFIRPAEECISQVLEKSIIQY